MRKVLVMMSTYNGEKYLHEQIYSILNQEEVDVNILVRDDRSKDTTLKFLETYKQEGKINFYYGENLKSARSFMDLIDKASEKYDYYAFSDQDDYWLPDKLISAINFLEKYDRIPALYMSSATIVDENLSYITDKIIKSFNNFENAVIKNEAIGCTQVFNLSLLRFLKMYKPDFIMMHDSWVCRVCHAIGGKVIIDEKSHILYRQHNNNVLGYHENAFIKLSKQYKIAFLSKIRIRELIAKELLNGYESIMPNNVHKLAIDLSEYPYSLKVKMKLLCNRKFKTPYKLINFKMRIAIILGKF